METDKKIVEAVRMLRDLGLPKEQQNIRTGLCLLALLNLTQTKKWKNVESPLIGITPMMDFARNEYGMKYAPNTRETFRRFSIHQLVQAGVVLQNPDNSLRPVNSPKTVYQIAPDAQALLKTFRTRDWKKSHIAYVKTHGALARRYAQIRKMEMIPVRMNGGQTLHLTPGAHSHLIREVVEQFVPRFMSGADLLYVGDTGKKWAYWEERGFRALGIRLDEHGKIPDVVVYDSKRKWLVLVEVVTSHGPVNPKRHEELNILFATSRAGLVFVTAFPDRVVMARHWNDLAWETEAWVADHPDHLIHLNGIRFLGPYGKLGRKQGDI